MGFHYNPCQQSNKALTRCYERGYTMKPKKKVWGIVGTAASCVLAATTIVADVLVAKYSSMINLYFRKDTITHVDKTADETLAAVREFTKKEEGEGAVLLKNDGLLPLTTSA